MGLIDPGQENSGGKAFIYPEPRGLDLVPPPPTKTEVHDFSSLSVAMALSYNYCNLSQKLQHGQSSFTTINWSKRITCQIQNTKRCLRCHTLYLDKDNSPTACSFHGHTTGEKGLFALAPPHQGIDGEWSDGSGVIVYKWNEKGNRPNTGRRNWKKRWSCCSEYGENAPPCRRGWHVSYDDGFTLY